MFPEYYFLSEQVAKLSFKSLLRIRRALENECELINHS